MRPVRAFGPSFRIVIAALFGFMSLAHGPVMAFAQEKAPQTQHQPAIHHQPAGHHLGHAAQHSGDHVQDAGDHGMDAAEHGHAPYRGLATVCYSNGCFVAVAPFPIGVPASASSPLQQLTPALAHAIVPAELDPAVPPPRLQA